MSDERDAFPSSVNLAKLSRSDNPRGELTIPLPYANGDVLVLRWEQIHGFEVSEAFALKWGNRHKYTRHGYHLLGKFFFNGEELLPGLSHSSVFGVEHFHECRFDEDGNDSMGSNVDFEDGGQHGWNTTLLMHGVSDDGSFEVETPALEIANTGRYRLFWESMGGSQWRLEMHDEEEFDAFSANDWAHFVLDLHEKTISFSYNYLPTDYD